MGGRGRIGRRVIPPVPPVPPVQPFLPDFRARELDHARRDVEADDARAARREGERDVPCSGGEIERARSAPRRREIDQPPLPAPILSIRQRHRDEVVAIGDRREQPSYVPLFPFGCRDQFNKSQGSSLKAQYKAKGSRLKAQGKSHLLLSLET